MYFEEKIRFTFPIDQIIPAVGQGVIEVQCRKNDTHIKNVINNINDFETSLCAKAEKKMLNVIGGDCETAIGGLAQINNNKMKLKAQLFSDDGTQRFDYELTGSHVDAYQIGKKVGEKLLILAGKKFKKK